MLLWRNRPVRLRDCVLSFTSVGRRLLLRAHRRATRQRGTAGTLSAGTPLSPMRLRRCRKHTVPARLHEAYYSAHRAASEDGGAELLKKKTPLPYRCQGLFGCSVQLLACSSGFESFPSSESLRLCSTRLLRSPLCCDLRADDCKSTDSTRREEIKYGTAQAKVSEDEAVRVAYKHGTPLETGKIADSRPVDLFVQAPRMAAACDNTDSSKPPATDRDVDSKPEQADRE
ncbi:hypothetical protein ZIOFF_053209 [Zingiber officinale]|uniref:Uncharacterized protein n=1 Tax=Zingiber officinale TaxID=94328 RepID=A0A8J5FIB8_ZINOF|nr:hypothetical protein ZIOFF_053209 [Zingiber officinale]